MHCTSSKCDLSLSKVATKSLHYLRQHAPAIVTDARMEEDLYHFHISSLLVGWRRLGEGGTGAGKEGVQRNYRNAACKCKKKKKKKKKNTFRCCNYKLFM